MRISILMMLAVSTIFGLSACSQKAKKGVRHVDSLNIKKIDSARIGLQPGATDFMTDAYYGGMRAIALSKLVNGHTQNPKIRSFANMMINDYKSANKKLKTFAEKQHVSLPDSLSQKLQSEQSNLDAKKEKNFNKIYMKKMLRFSRNSVKKFKNEMGNTKSAQLKSWVSSVVPDIQKHLDSAMAIEQQLQKK